MAFSIRHVTPWAALALLLVTASLCAQEPALDLKRIMSDPEWIGRQPEQPYWSSDGRSIYFSRKRQGQQERDLYQLDRESGFLRLIADAERGGIDVTGGDWSKDRRRKVYAHRGDLFLRDLSQAIPRQLTRTEATEQRPQFLLDETRIAFQRGGSWLVRDLISGLEYEAAILRFQDPPKPPRDDDYLAAQQQRLFDHLREGRERRQVGQDRQDAARRTDPTRPPRPFYLGTRHELVSSSLSPDARWMLLRLRPKGSPSARRDSMPVFVTDSGYVDNRSVRSKVGTAALAGEELVLLDLWRHERFPLSFEPLPEWKRDPFAEIRAWKPTAAEAAAASASGKTSPPERPLRIGRIRWSPSGARAAISLYSRDNKDYWIALVTTRPQPSEAETLPKPSLRAIVHDQDEAWINARLLQFGWLKDDRGLWFTSERSGYHHLYRADLATDSAPIRVRALTSGDFELSSIVLGPQSRFLYALVNEQHPGVHEVHRIELDSGTRVALTALGGRTRFALSPAGEHLLLTHSRPLQPPELYIQAAAPGAPVRRLTHTVSAGFQELPWVEPEVVAVRSRIGRPIWSRIYDTQKANASETTAERAGRPAVVFVHGAGYLQNAHKGWSDYFREFMFHSLLAHEGFVVLDMDYRASAGYGRDWRTAIYRQMGTPEVEDLEDGVQWLVRYHGVDPERVGVYGGSYGGFLTLMALFKQPELFACGAALRPVTDWAHYNHPYTANILNTPTLDPEAYERSSPIEFAEGLNKPLLICHGMLDDNVFFKDTVRLAQRLIELEKENWEVAIYPVEPHGFRNPSSWLDEYRRIHRLFREHLLP